MQVQVRWRLSLCLVVSALPVVAQAQIGPIRDVLEGRSLAGQVVKGAAVGLAVKQYGKQLNSFINTVTLKKGVPQRLATRVVPILSVGERGYIGGAQVTGPKSLVNKVQAVWQYEDDFQKSEYRVKALVPSSSLNPLKIQRVPKVGLSALIDVSLGGGVRRTSESAGVGAGRILRDAAVAGAVILAAKPLDSFINTLTFNKGAVTKVVPQVSVGERGYIGGAQVTGATSELGKVKAVFEYWDTFSNGQFRIRAIVPVNGIDPTKIRRVDGVGVLALVDTSLAAQRTAERRRSDPRLWRSYNPWAGVPTGSVRKDQGLHLGWEIGKHKGWDKRRPESPDRGNPIRLDLPGVLRGDRRTPTIDDRNRRDDRGEPPAVKRDDRGSDGRDRRREGNDDTKPKRDDGRLGGRGRRPF